ncbi:hypothetical protein AMTR_s00025p00249350 [Amborella trichopoda]|uniref:Uncharacterized protein n=1 Tax=Amborella trichopoda TaxID=13333 RepID=W1PYV1_AMBTC|nr:hypothetical protein AMTR_s00025p00249350 [Amborella trichopoda]
MVCSFSGDVSDQMRKTDTILGSLKTDPIFKELGTAVAVPRGKSVHLCVPFPFKAKVRKMPGPFQGR